MEQNQKKSKKALAVGGTAAVLVIGALIVGFSLRTPEKPEFVPNPPVSGTTAATWEESSTISETAAPETTPAETTASITVETTEQTAPATTKQTESYPKQAESEKNKVVVNFNDPEPEKPVPPPTPKTTGDVTNPEAPPEYKPEETTVQQTTAASKAGQPQPGDKNEKGQVYMEGFGWVTPAKTHGIAVDNDGDPNKMVGIM